MTRRDVLYECLTAIDDMGVELQHHDTGTSAAYSSTAAIAMTEHGLLGEGTA